MITDNSLKTMRILAGIGSVVAVLLGPNLSLAQTPDPKHAQHHPPDKAKGPLDPLEKALEKSDPKSSKMPTSKKKTTAMARAPKKQSMNMNATAGGSSMSGMMGTMDQMMGQMSGNKSGMQQSSSELPGYPGASHIYHIGATGYFLDHEDMISLTDEQLTTLNKIKERSLLSQSSLDRKIEQGEEDLWQLTASDRPDIKSIEEKIKEIEAHKSQQRITFIRDVGEAAGVLTGPQRSILLGNSPPESSNQNSAPKPKGQMPGNAKPDSGMNSMGDM